MRNDVTASISVAVLMTVGGCSPSIVTTTKAPGVAPGTDRRLAVMESCYAEKNALMPTVHIYIGDYVEGAKPTKECDDKFYVPVPCTFKNTWLSPTQVRVELTPTKETPDLSQYAPRTYRYDPATNITYRANEKGEIKLKPKWR